MKRSKAPSILAQKAPKLNPEASSPPASPPPPPAAAAIIESPPLPEQDWQSARGPPAILRLTPEECHAAWKIATTRVEHTLTGCFLANGKGFTLYKGATSKWPYRQISFVPGKNNVRPLAHVFAWYYWNVVQVQRHVYNPAHHISHRCGVHACINPEHLVQEPGEQNEARKNCVQLGSYSLCPHTPKCIGHKNL